MLLRLSYGTIYKNKTLNTDKEEVKEIVINPATEDEVYSTERVMGGDDWCSWTEKLLEADLLAPGCLNLAYSYIGPEVTRAIYRNGTIGKAKERNKIVGTKLSSRCAPEKLSSNGTLFLRAANGPVKQELSFIKKKIISRISRLDGCAFVRDIKIT